MNVPKERVAGYKHPFREDPWTGIDYTATDAWNADGLIRYEVYFERWSETNGCEYGQIVMPDGDFSKAFGYSYEELAEIKKYLRINYRLILDGILLEMDGGAS